MPVTIPGALMVTVKGEIFSDRWANVFGFATTYDAPLNATNADALADAVAACYVDNLAAVLVSGWSLDTINVLDIRTSTGPSHTSSYTISGALASDSLPTFIAGGVVWHTGKRGSRYRGRTFLPGWSEGSNDAEGRPSAGAVSAMENFAADLRDVEAGGALATLAVLSRKYEEYSLVLSHDVVPRFWKQSRRGRA